MVETVLKALLPLHELGMAHGNLKSTNIFLSPDQQVVGIGDYGVKNLLQPFMIS